MPIEYKQPKLKDSLYGEMLWENDFDETYWFSRIRDAAIGEPEILIYADSPSDFMAVCETHRTYQNILSGLTKIKSDSAHYLLENERDLRFQKSRYKDFAAKKIEGELRLFWALHKNCPKCGSPHEVRARNVHLYALTSCGLPQKSTFCAKPLFCIKIFQDLSSTVIFDSEMFDETDEFVFTLLANDGGFIESSINTF